MPRKRQINGTQISAILYEPVDMQFLNLRKLHGLTTTQAIQHAIRVWAALEAATTPGNTIAVITPDGATEPLQLPEKQV